MPAAVVTATTQAAIRFLASGGEGSSAILASQALQGMAGGKIKATALVVLSLMAASVIGYQVPALGGRPEHETKQQADGPKAESRQPKTDFFGDPLPRDAIARLGTIRWRLDGHYAESMAASPEGKTLVSVNAIKGITVFEAATGKVLRQIPQRPELRKEWLSRDWWAPSALSGDARTVALAPSADAVYVIDVNSGKARCTLRSRGRVTRAALSGDGHFLAALTDEGHLQVWDTAKGELLRELPSARKLNDPHKPQWLALSADGKTLAWVGEDGACPIHVVDLTTGKERHRLGEHEGDSRHVTMAPDGKLLAASSTGGLVQLWDVEEGKIRHKWPGKKDGPFYPMTAFSPDGKNLVVTRGGDAMRLLDTGTGKELCQVGRKYSNSVQDAYAFAPDGKTLYVTQLGDSIIHRYDAETGKRRLLPGEKWRVGDVAFSPDEKKLRFFDDEGLLCSWEFATGKDKQADQAAVYARWGVFSPDGRHLMSGARVGCDLRDGTTGRVVRHFPERNRAFSPNGRLVALDDEKAIVVRETSSGNQVGRVSAPPSPFNSFAFTPDGERLAVLSGDENSSTLHFWDAASPRGARTVPVPPCDVSTLLFAPDGRTFVVGAPRDKSPPGVLIVETATGQQRQHVRFDKILPGYTWPPNVSFSPGGEYLLIGDGAAGVSIVDPLTGELLHRRQEHRGNVLRMVFSSSGRLLATAGGDGSILIWNAADFLRPARPKRITLTAAELASVWEDLGSADAPTAAVAMRKLTRAAAQCEHLLSERLQPAAAVTLDAKKLAQWLADLDSDAFDTRKKAEAEIEKLGEPARPALEQVLAGQPSLEVRRNAERLLAKLDPAGSPSQRRMLRAVEVLEHVATPEARAVLESLAKGAPEARLTGEAKAALERLQRQQPAP
jgi:WD40 repeat protein